MRLLFSAVLFVGVVSLSACGGNENNNNPDAGTPTNPLACQGNEPSVTSQQLFTDVVGSAGQCNTCHFTGAPTGTGGGVVMDTAATLAANSGKDSAYGSGIKVVDPNHPENSTMFLKSAGGSPDFKGPHGESVGARMPQGLQPLTDAQVTEIKNWICSGAQ